MHTIVLSQNLKRRDHLENMGMDGRILKLILNKQMAKPVGAQASGSHPIQKYLSRGARQNVSHNMIGMGGGGFSLQGWLSQPT
jgi:hypothetical protein